MGDGEWIAFITLMLALISPVFAIIWKTNMTLQRLIQTMDRLTSDADKRDSKIETQDKKINALENITIQHGVEIKDQGDRIHRLEEDHRRVHFSREE